MVLSQMQSALLAEAQSQSSGNLRVALDDPSCRAVLYQTARDLEVSNLEIPKDLPTLFDANPPSSFRVAEGPSPRDLLESLVASDVPDTDSYFKCLAKLQKARLKYERILEAQPVPTMDQVGPRALLQYGASDASDLAALLVWRKFIYDLDNRSAQETGYLFEPILAAAIGGAPMSAKSSPIKRREKPGGRQVDAIKGMTAYEFKIRMTIAASGQGRWGEELAFPADAQASGYTPVLIVLDPTPSAKLTELARTFANAGGHSFIGDAAWAHLEETAGVSMARFIERYVRLPLRLVLDGRGGDATEVPDITFALSKSELSISIEGGGSIKTARASEPDDALFDA